MKFPVLETQRLILTEIKETHLNDLFQLYKDPDVTRYYNLLPFVAVSEGLKFIEWYRERFMQGLGIRWGIVLKENKNEVLVGTLGFNNYTKNHRAVIGYDLQKQYWNQGYITEGLRAIIRFGFDQLSVNRIEAEVMPGNIASEKVLEKIGFCKEGILRQWMFWNETYYDMSMYALLHNDYVNL